MATNSIEELFDMERLPQGYMIFPIFFYFPLGLVLALLRLFIGLHAFLLACILPKTAAMRSFLLRTICFVLGIVVMEGHQKHKNRATKILVTNHVTILDHLAVDLVFPCTMPSVWDLPKVLTWGLGFKDLGVKQGREVLVQNVKQHCQGSELPILAHPEGATTNGRAGLLKFSTWPFCIGEAVTPVVLEVRRPYLLNISLSVIGSRWWSDLFWFLFSPCTMFTVRYLPEMRPDEDTPEEEFTRQVQEAMASALGVQATNYTCADKVEYVKRVLFRPSAQGLRTSPDHSNPHITRMAYQVKDVLPYVPLDAIKQDLVRTNSVSLTIGNILEGVVQYVPELEVTPLTATAQPPSTSSASTAASSARVSSDSPESGHSTSQCTDSPNQYYMSLNTAASTFGKSADERMLSYQERKRRLIETARQRYMEKHCLS